jgi:hypothetical protein
MEIEEETRNSIGELDGVLREIGQTVVDGEQPNVMAVHRAQELQGILQRLWLQRQAVRDQVRAAIREKLTTMLSTEVVEAISDDELDHFYDELENASHSQISISRMLSSGLEALDDREPENGQQDDR